jgi:hypothetical protein
VGRTPCSPSHRQNIRIDVHHHFFLDAQKKAKKNSEVGWRTPEGNLPWGPQTSLTAMDKLGIQTAILSPPPISSTSYGAENRVEVRNQNIYASQLCAAYPSRFGFFAGLPFLDDVEGTFSCEASFRVVDLTSFAKNRFIRGDCLLLRCSWCRWSGSDIKLWGWQFCEYGL